MHPLLHSLGRSRLLLALAVGLLAPIAPVRARTDLTFYTNGQTLSDNFTTTIPNTLVVNFSNRTNVTYAGVLTGAYSLALNGDGGQLTLTNGASNFTGDTRLSYGTLILGSATALQNSTLNLAAVDVGAFSFGSLTSATIGGLAGSRALALSNGSGAAVALSVGNNNLSFSYSGVLSGNGSLIKIGTGTLTLSGANTYSGTTTVSAGTLEVGTGGTLGSGAIVNHAALLFNHTNAATVATAISGTGSLTMTGTGTLTLSAANTYTGATTVSGGTLDLAYADNNIGTGSIRGPLVINSGGTVLTSATNALGWASGAKVDSITINAGGLLNHTATSDQGWGVAYTLNGGTMQSNGGVSNALAGSNFAFGNSTSVTVGTNTGTSTLAGRVNLRGDTGNTTVGFNVGAGSTLNLTAAVTSANGAVGLTKTGAGTLALSGANTYTGATLINVGLVAFSAANNFGTGNITLNGGGLRWSAGTATDISGRLTALGAGGATFDTNGNNVVFASALTGDGALLKTGAGTLTLSGANTYAGGTTVSGGTLALGAGNRLANAGALTVAGGTFDLGAYSETIGAFWLSSGAITGTGTLTASSFAFSPASAATVSVILDGSALLTKSGDGVLTLSGANTYTGGTTIAGGTLALASSGALGAGGTIAFNGGALQFSAANTTDYSARFSTAAGQLYRFDTNGQNVTLATAFASPGGSFTKLGAGTLTVSADYSGSGNANGTGFGVGGTGGAFTLSGGSATFTTYSNNGGAAGGARGTGGTGGAFALSGGGTATFTTYSGNGGNSTNGTSGSGGAAGHATVSNGTATFSTYSSTGGNSDGYDGIGNGGAGGNFTLSGGSAAFTTYSSNGGNGARNIYNPNPGGSGGQGGHFTLSGGSATFSTYSSIGGNGGRNDFGGTGGVGGNGGNFTLSGGSAFFQSDSSLLLTGGYGGSGGSAGASGTLAVTGGTLSLPTLAWLNTTATFQGNLTFTTGTLQARDATETLTLADTSKLGAALDTVSSATRTLALAGGLTLDSTIALRGTGALVKAGTGTLTLQGAHTYTGMTTVNAGTLVVNDSLANTAVTIANTATLGGSGTINGFTTIQAGGHLAPGNSPGTLTFTNGLTLADGAILDFQLGTTSDQIALTGGLLSVTGVITVNLTNAGGFTAGTYTLIDATANASSSALSSIGATTFELGTVIGGYSYTFSQTAGTLDLIVSAIPEPGATAMLAAVCTLAFACTRRRSK